MQSKYKKCFLNLLLLSISVLFSIGILEIYAINFLKIPYYTLDSNFTVLDDELTRGYKVNDEKIGFLPGPEWFGREGILGCQNGREYLKNKKAALKIVILGDSVIQNRYLEKSLKFILKDMHYEIFNAGIGAYNTMQEAYYLKEHIAVPFNILILGFCLNDFEPPYTIIIANNKEKFARNLFEPLGHVNPFLFRNSALYRYFKIRTINLLKKEEIWSKEAVLKNKDVKEGLQGILKYCDSKNAKLFVIIYPHLESYRKDSFLEAAHEKIIEILNELKINFLDLHEVYKNYDYKNLIQNQQDTCHPNFYADFIAAREFLNRFYSQLGLTKEYIANSNNLSFDQSALEGFEKSNSSR